MTSDSQRIVQKLWSYCNILRDDGLSYPDYVEQLTFLLFLKMTHEQSQTSQFHRNIVPPRFDWHSLVSKKGKALHSHYSAVLKELAKGKGMLGLIFRGAENKIRDPAKLGLLVSDLIDRENWSSLDADVKGDAYEGLLDKNAQDTKSGAGQYFTPRPLIQAVVECIRPLPGETICDPACGTGGFLLAAHDYIVKSYPRLSAAQKRHLASKAFRGVELVDAVTRLGAMNLLLHGIGPVADERDLPIRTADSLAADPGGRFDIVLTNPPFGKKGSVTLLTDAGERERQTLSIVRNDFWSSTTNKQLGFVQHVRTLLKTNGRAAIVVPDNVLFEGGAGEVVRRNLLQECDVHTLLRLPTGIFYAQGVKANVLFFDRKPATEKMWVFDLRTNVTFTLRTNPLRRTDLDEFVECYVPTDRQRRKPTWTPHTPRGRWRAFTRDELESRDRRSFDIFWLKPDAAGVDEISSDPDAIAAGILRDLKAAVKQIEGITADLNRSE
jgi:type I restriction enzyme M protein